MAGDGEGETVPAAERVRWSEGLGARIVDQTAAGETLRGMCREAGMPAFRTVEGWLARKPSFRAAIDEARVAAGGAVSGAALVLLRGDGGGYLAAAVGGGAAGADLLGTPAMPVPGRRAHRWRERAAGVPALAC